MPELFCAPNLTILNHYFSSRRRWLFTYRLCEGAQSMKYFYFLFVIYYNRKYRKTKCKSHAVAFGNEFKSSMNKSSMTVALKKNKSLVRTKDGSRENSGGHFWGVWVKSKRSRVIRELSRWRESLREMKEIYLPYLLTLPFFFCSVYSSILSPSIYEHFSP